jgi:hypothetical protein
VISHNTHFQQSCRYVILLQGSDNLIQILEKSNITSTGQPPLGLAATQLI